MPDILELEDSPNTTWAGEIIRMARTEVQPIELEPSSRYALPTADGRYELLDFTTPDCLFSQGWDPVCPVGSPEFTEHQGFIDYVKNHGTLGRVEIWANLPCHSVVAVLDGHLRRTGGEDTDSKKHGATAGWGVHRAYLRLQTSPEWKAWRAIDKIDRNQTEFAEFLDDNLQDVVEPNAATLMEMVSKLSVTTGVSFSSAITLSSGETKLLYLEDQQQKGDLKLPRTITIGVSPFLGLPAYRISARLRYRINSQKVSFKLLLDRPHIVERDALAGVLLAITEGTGLMVYHGQPSPPLVSSKVLTPGCA